MVQKSTAERVADIKNWVADLCSHSAESIEKNKFEMFAMGRLKDIVWLLKLNDRGMNAIRQLQLQREAEESKKDVGLMGGDE